MNSFIDIEGGISGPMAVEEYAHGEIAGGNVPVEGFQIIIQAAKLKEIPVKIIAGPAGDLAVKALGVNQLTQLIVNEYIDTGDNQGLLLGSGRNLHI